MMLGGKLHPKKTTKIHVFWSNLAKQRFILMIWRYILTFNAKIIFKKISPILTTCDHVFDINFGMVLSFGFLILYYFISCVHKYISIVDTVFVYIFFNILQDKIWKRTAILAVYHATNKKREKLYDVYRPNTGRQPHPESLSILQRKYKKVRDI